MKAVIIALLVGLVLIAGCQKAAAPVAPTEPSAQPSAPEAAPTEPTTGSAPVLQEDQAVIDRYVTACKAGNAGLCATLKNKYNMDVSPEPKAAQ